MWDGACMAGKWRLPFLFVISSDLIYLYLLMYSEGAKVGEREV